MENGLYRDQLKQNMILIEEKIASKKVRLLSRERMSTLLDTSKENSILNFHEVQLIH